MTTVSEILSDFACTARPEESAIGVLRLSFLDWAGVGVAGQEEPVSRLLRAQALDEGGTMQAGLIGSKTRVPARAAALVNGTTSHALDYDDTHFDHIGHPSVAVLPAALATAQLCGATGKSLQEAALIGAEASVRMGIWLGRAHYQAGFHQTATAGAFGACLASCRLLGLNRAQIGMALGVVSTRASGLKSQFGTMGKPMNAGIAAANGVEAALLAKRGFVSRGAAIDGAQGFGPSHHGEALQSAWDGLGQDWVFERVSHKFHACCHGLHAMLEALTPVIGTSLDDIAAVEIMTHPRWLSVCNIKDPCTGLESKFSYRQTAAMRLLDHATSLPASFTDDVCLDAEILALREKITVIADEALSEMQARVVVRSADGDVKELAHDLQAEMSLSDRETRIRAKVAALIGSERSDELWRHITQDASPDVIAATLA